MFETYCLAIDIGSNSIKFMYGNKNEIKYCDNIPTPQGSIEDDRIVNEVLIKDTINSYIRLKEIKTKDVAFSIHGQDIIIRHTESPIIDEKGLMSSVQWEIGQYLPEGGKNYYIDYEIIQKINTKNKKVLNLLVVAAPKEKVDVLISLARSLQLNIKAIDISANCIARACRNAAKISQSIGVINIGFTSTSLCIIDKGKLFMEREVPFGINNVLKEIMTKLNVDSETAYSSFMSNFNFNNIGEAEVLNKRIQGLFDNVFSSFIKVIEFYNTGKLYKNLDRIYIIGGGCNINGIEYYVNKYFSTQTTIADTFEKLYINTKHPADVSLRFYISNLGLLLRKE